ncbi:MAG TPA: F0F1 ATP synthase subunit A [Acidimicrobiales bacterium]|nr:F0F1 ATP synthase subunit A [Acidimicrobiales bacterium]HLN42176.1 F0F1 ATP synthase subunit A [Acidimicrobiales bacterium]
MIASVHFLATNIEVGTHVQRDGLDLDTIWSTVAAMVIVMAMGLTLRARATSGVPGKLQLVWEWGVEAVQKQVEGTIGPRGAAVVPLAVALFVFILVANWFSVLGIGSEIEWIGTPTSDINVTLALALIVIIPVHIASIRSRGFVGYIKHYVGQPFPKALFLVNIFINGVEEIAKPLTLALRLFGNLLSGGLMLALIAALGVWSISHVPIGDIATVILNPVWKVFDLAIGAIQAFIFSLLTILYFDTAMSDAH